ncbi:MAG: hypothetical protein L3K26_14810 [Candidatus Hydrogenedentes bacterium]|nr:hypothetical protein [Candidatus Hydrogenedentota bacterium]
MKRLFSIVLPRRARRSAGYARLFFGPILLVFLVVFGAVAEEQVEKKVDRKIAVVTHLKNTTTSLTRSELSRMFTKKKTTWPNGKRCIPIDQLGDSKIRARFSTQVLRKSVYQMTRYWMQETMTGNAKPPVSLESAATVKKYIQKLEGAVGYIYADEVDDSIRVLAVLDPSGALRGMVKKESSMEVDEPPPAGSGAKIQ